MNNNEYIKIGDRGAVVRGQITGISCSGNSVLVYVETHDTVLFDFANSQLAQAATADAVAQLTGDSEPKSEYRFFRRSSGKPKKCYVVPSDGSQRGRSFIENGCAVRVGPCKWDLSEMFKGSEFRTEVSQAEFEAFAGNNWRSKL